jgi:hypothetical protein
MWNWLVSLLRSLLNNVQRWTRGEKIPQSYHRSNLHGRHR